MEKYLSIFDKFFWSLENSFKYTVLRKNVRNSRIRVSNDLCVTVIVPKNCPDKNIENLIHNKRNWINKTLSRLKNNSKTIELSRDEILLLGSAYKFEIDASLENKVHTSGVMKKVISGQNLMTDKILRVAWYKHIANKFIKQRVSEIADKNGFVFNRIFIRDQKTKWGTCSSNKNLSFNWRIILCPMNVLDYLIVHELSHLNQMNHSAKFWQSVETLCPDYRYSKKWLKEHEAFLFKY